MVDLLLVRSRAVEIERYIVDHGADLHAPHLLDVEVASALRRLVNTGEAPADRGHRRDRRPARIPDRTLSAHALLPRIWELREHISAYDATYVALAEAMTEPSSPLLTTDERLARAVAATSRCCLSSDAIVRALATHDRSAPRPTVTRAWLTVSLTPLRRTHVSAQRPEHASSLGKTAGWARHLELHAR
ncbi:MAG: hypothetical protein QOD83_3516 [Solirubrobacteraceae bacterium]|nr:hypothetical protein [Solirubrobacteraceae bacterium]